MNRRNEEGKTERKKGMKAVPQKRRELTTEAEFGNEIS